MNTQIKTTNIKVRTTNIAIWFFTLLLGTLGLGLLISSFLPRNDYIDIVLTIFVFLFANYLQRFTSRGEIEISFLENAVFIQWQKQFIFHKKKDLQIPFATIKNYKYQHDMNFDLFLLTMKDESEFKIWHWNSFKGDDFSEFVLAFAAINDHFQKLKNEFQFSQNLQERKIDIKREKTIYETEDGMVLAIIGAVMIITILYFFFTSKHSSDIYPALTCVGGGIFFIAQVIRYRLKNKPKK